MVQSCLGRTVRHERRATGGMARATGDVDDRPGPVLFAHLAVGANGEPQRTDEIHLHGKGMEQDGAFELVVAARTALDLLNELRNRLDVRGRHRSSRVVHEDIEAAVRIDDPLYEGVDRLLVGLITHPLLGPLYSARHGVGTGKARQLGPGTPHDRRAGEQQLAGDADPHTATRPGDDRDRAVERTHPTPKMMKPSITLDTLWIFPPPINRARNDSHRASSPTGRGGSRPSPTGLNDLV